MSSLPPNRNIPPAAGGIQQPNGGELVKRTGTERAIEDSMRHWYAMRDERDQALDQLAELRTKLVEVNAEKAILHGRNLDLEEKFERLLVDFTRMRVQLESIGGLGDTISLAVSELLSLSRSTPARTRTEQYRETPEDPGVAGTQQPDTVPREGETIQEVARRLVQETDHLTLQPERSPSWLPHKK